MVDLGVPDYGYKHFYILIKSENKNSEIYFRRSLIELKRLGVIDMWVLFLKLIDDEYQIMQAVTI